MSSSSESLARTILRALAWPFSLTPALFVVFAGTGFALTGLIMRHTGLIGLAPALALAALLSVATSRYLFIVLVRATMGHAEAPLLSVHHFNPADDMRFSLVLAWLLLIGASGLFASPLLTSALVLVSLVVMPAALVLLAVTGDVIACMNPARQIKFMRRAGLPYIAMASTLLPMAAGLLAIFTGRPPFVTEISGMYLVTVAFFLLGRIAYENRTRLGFRAEKSPELDRERNAAAADKRMQQLLDRIHPLGKVHEYQQALTALENAVEELGGGETVADAFTERVLAWENPEVGLLYLRKRITSALSDGQTDSAWRLCQRGLAVTSRFHPETGDEAVLLTRYGCETGAHRKAMLLVMAFEERYPQLPELLPAAAVLEAKAVAEKLGRPQAARARLRQLCQKHPSCADSSELLTYLEILDRAD